MTVNVSKPVVNVREKLAELDKPTGIAGEAMLRAETPQEQFNLIGAGRRNLIINGAMQVAQRGTSFSATDGYTVDRWRFDDDLLDQYAHTATKSTDAPAGFGSSFKVEVTTTETAIDSVEDLAFSQRIEAQDLQQLGAGTSSPKPVTVSFWVKSSVTGTYAAHFKLEDDNRIFPFTYTIDAASTWEYKTINIPPCTIATVDNDTGHGATLRFLLLSGSNYTSGSTGTWQPYASNLFAAGHQAQISTDGDTWQITGVQLEVGKVATPFEHRSYGEELALCQRYAIVYGGAETRHLGTGSMYNASSVNFSMHTPVHMRAQPALIKTTNGSGNWLQVYVGATGNNSNPTPQLGEGGDTNTFRIYAPNVGLNQTVGLGTWVQVLDGASLLLDAEL